MSRWPQLPLCALAGRPAHRHRADNARNVVTGNVMAGGGIALPPGAGLGSYGDDVAPAQATVSGVTAGRAASRPAC